MQSYGEKRWGKPPPGYIPGLGRGAVGFTTRMDLGPNRNIENFQYLNEKNLNNYIDPSNNNKIEKFQAQLIKQKLSNDEKLFNNELMDDEDKDANEQYNFFDKYMSERNKNNKFKIENNKNNKARISIKQTFSDLKLNLKKMSDLDWENIPEVKDFSKKRKKKERYIPMTDNEILSALNDTITPLNLDNNTNSISKLENLSSAKNSYLQIMLDKTNNNINNNNNSIDAINYFSELSNINNQNKLINYNKSEIQDIKKTKLLLNNLILTNQNNPSSWLALARLEELDGKVEEARKVILNSLKIITNNEDLWLEAARLLPINKSIEVLLKGLTYLKKSEKLWLTLINYEKDKNKQKEYLKFALENVTSSEKLWKKLIDNEKDDIDKTKEILYKAIKYLPNSIEMWLALAKLETYEKSKKILENAIDLNKNSYDLYIHLAILEETKEKNEEKILNVLNNAFEYFNKNNIKISNEEWIKESIKCEKINCIITAKNIIKLCIQNNYNNNYKEIKKIFLKFINLCEKEGCLECIINIYLCILETNNYEDTLLWLNLINFLKNYEKKNEIQNIIKLALDLCKKNKQKETFSLLYAKYLLKEENITNSINFLTEYYNKFKSTNIIIALIKLYNLQKNYDKSFELLKKNLDIKYDERLHMYLINQYRLIKDYQNSLNECDNLLNKNKYNYKIYLIKSQIHIESNNNIEESINILKECIKIIPDQPIIYIELSKYILLLNDNNISESRTILEKGLSIKNNENNELIWINLIELELKNNNIKIAKKILSRAINKFNIIYKEKKIKYTILLSYSIKFEDNNNRQSKAIDYLQLFNNDAYIMYTIGNIYSSLNDIINSRKWYENALRENKDIGDIWLFYYKSELDLNYEENKEEYLNNILKRFEDSEPRHGILWPKIKKNIKNWNKNVKDILKENIFKIDYNQIFQIDILL